MDIELRKQEEIKGSESRPEGGPAFRTGRASRRPKRMKFYSVKEKVRAVKMFLEEGIPKHLIREEIGPTAETLNRWIRTYKTEGIEGLEPKKRIVEPKLPQPVKDKIVELKQQKSWFGVKRISQWLRRVFCIGVSPETIRKTLHEAELMPEKKKQSPKKNVSKPRFFERSTPNQLWQSDIFMFRIGGKQVYLIGYIDDYSRFLVGLELYGSQTGANVLELYRRSVSTHGVPKEMLTDNGRQYAAWRGKTRFQRELQKDRVQHFRSQPHHPMTLGKIEMFWQTIHQEFLTRATFVDFEEARDRIRKWVQYYNFRRPHQGIGGLCPADRFYEVRQTLKKTLDDKVQENILELALRGKQSSPFFMTGRIDDKSVVMRTEKGKLHIYNKRMSKIFQIRRTFLKSLTSLIKVLIKKHPIKN